MKDWDNKYSTPIKKDQSLYTNEKTSYYTKDDNYIKERNHYIASDLMDKWRAKQSVMYSPSKILDPKINYEAYESTNYKEFATPELYSERLYEYPSKCLNSKDLLTKVTPLVLTSASKHTISPSQFEQYKMLFEEIGRAHV